MLPILQLGPLSIQTPGLLLLLGLWLGLMLSERAARKAGDDPAVLYNLAFLMIITGALGARLAYVLRYPDAFAGSWLSVFTFSPTMLDAPSGLLVAALGGLIFLQRKHMPLWHTLDILTGAFAVLAVTIGLAHLASGDAFGAPADLPWSIALWGELRHPSQVYETLAAAAIFFALRPWTAPSGPAGNRFLAFCAFTAGAVIFLDAFRGDSVRIAGRFHQNQVIGLLVLTVSLFMRQRIATRQPMAAGPVVEDLP